MLTILVLCGVAALLTSIMCLMGRCPPGVPCLLLAVCVLINCIPTK